MRSASNLRRHCSYPEVLARIKPRSERQQAAMDIGTMFHKAVEAWAKTGDLWAGVQLCGSDEVRGWLELLAMSWQPPHESMGPRYEFALGLGVDGSYVPVVESEPHQYAVVNPNLFSSLLTAGRADAVWSAPILGGVVYVADFKTGRYAVEQPATNLQLAALGLAAADMRSAEAMNLGVYYARDGAWDWSGDIDMNSPEAAALWADVEAAALLDDGPHSGPHCSSCWDARLNRCQFAQGDSHGK